MKPSKWNSLNYLDLGIFSFDVEANAIGDKGCKYLTRLDVRFLRQLILCKIVINKRTIISQQSACIIFQRDNGLFSKFT